MSPDPDEPTTPPSSTRTPPKRRRVTDAGVTADAATGATSTKTVKAAKATKLDPDELAALEDQRNFLLASIRDLEREYEAGDLDETDYRTLRDDYTARAAETLRAIKERRSAFADARRRGPIGRRLLVIGGVVVFAAVAGFLVARSIGARGANDSLSGGMDLSLTPNQQAKACQADIDQSNMQPAITCFEGVLKQDPQNAIANTWLAWLLELSNTSDSLATRNRVESLIDKAVASNPDYSYALAFRAIIAFRHGDAAKAKTYLATFEATNPSGEAKSIIDQFQISERIDQALEGDPNDVEAARCRGLIDPQTPTPAITCFKAVLEKDPSNVIANTWLGWQVELASTYVTGAQGTELAASAETLLDRALTTSPKDPYALAIRSLVALRHGDVTLAQTMLDRFEATDPPQDAVDLVDQMGLKKLIAEAETGSTTAATTTTTG